MIHTEYDSVLCEVKSGATATMLCMYVCIRTIDWPDNKEQDSVCSFMELFGLCIKHKTGSFSVAADMWG